MKIAILSQIAVNEAVLVIKKEGVVVFPTDTVYGFLADATNKKAVEKIYKIKKRPRSKPLPVFVSSIKQAKKIAEIDQPAFAKGFGEARQEKILKKYWPGKFTFILKRKPGAKIFGIDKNTIALRIPKYKFLNDLLEKVNRPLVQTSVNISGEPELNSIEEIINEFDRQKIKPDLIIDAGDLPKSKPSKIIDLTSARLTRLR